jgi:glycosyltransferase involved in cell wall biosynthesis
VENEPKVSVCVLTYNHAAYIRSCLQSIVDQVLTCAFEVIVSDDCSTDGTREIVKEFGERYPAIVRPVLHPVNIGGTQNFIGIHNLARGRYVAHIDGDDLMLPGKLQRQADFLDANPGCSVVWHKVNLIDDDGGFVPGENYDLSFFPGGIVTLDHAFRLGMIGAHSSMMYRRSVRRTRQADGEVLDMYYTWEYLSGGTGKMLDDVLGSYRVGAAGSVQVRNMIKIQTLIAHHALYYLALMPEQRRNIFVLALISFMVEVKSRRRSAWAFAKLLVESVSLVSPALVFKTISEMQRIHPCSPRGNIDIARFRRTEPAAAPTNVEHV